MYAFRWIRKRNSYLTFFSFFVSRQVINKSISMFFFFYLFTSFALLIWLVERLAFVINGKFQPIEINRDYNYGYLLSFSFFRREFCIKINVIFLKAAIRSFKWHLFCSLLRRRVFSLSLSFFLLLLLLQQLLKSTT